MMETEAGRFAVVLQAAVFRSSATSVPRLVRTRSLRSYFAGPFTYSLTSFVVASSAFACHSSSKANTAAVYSK